MNVKTTVPEQVYTPSPYSDNINGNGRVDEYANNIPKTPVSTQFYNPELFKDAENIRVNFTYAVPEVIVTPSPYDRLNSGNSNYDKNTVRKNNSDSYPIDIYDDYGDDADFVMGYYYDIGDDEYYYYIVDDYYYWTIDEKDNSPCGRHDDSFPAAVYSHRSSSWHQALPTGRQTGQWNSGTRIPWPGRKPPTDNQPLRLRHAGTPRALAVSGRSQQEHSKERPLPGKREESTRRMT